MRKQIDRVWIKLIDRIKNDMNVQFPDSAPAHRRLVRVAGLAIFAVSALLPLAAQQPAPQPPPAQQTPPPAAQQPAQNPAQNPATPDTDQVLRVGVNEVNLIFTVTDKHGHYIPNLQQSDFALLDDQKAPAKITSFRQQTNLPLRVGVVIDASTSIRTRFEFEQQSAVEFLLSTLKPRSDKAFVMGFDVTPNVTQDWTNNLDGLETGINRLRPGGGTALYDAVYTACRDKLLSQRGLEPVRKAMILITDGDDNQSRVHQDEAIKMCQRADTIIYAISTNWTPSRGKGDKVLFDMATATGGVVFYPPSVEEMSSSFKDIAAELRSQYLLTYTPADFKLDGSFRTIYLYCNDRRYEVRGKKGYFATAQ
jgi:Ca-activated chloride channel family protein